MARFASGTVERVKDAVDMAALVGAKTDLRRAGGRLQGLCPFHDERTPSFSVDPAQKLYHCFGCGASGDAITFVEETEGLDFASAVEVLAERFGVEVTREKEDPRAEAERQRKERLRLALDRAARFYFRVLMERDEGAAALSYLEGRGLGREVLGAFRVGFAPAGGRALVGAARKQGFTDRELGDAGLARRGGGGGDYFRNRITFPISDVRGRVVGFGARAMSAEERAKYVNSPEGILFRKKEIVFGLDRARGAIARNGRAILVEGYTDVLAANQAGFEETVAVMGTAVTPEQLGRLSGAETVVMALDADRAGQDAMVRAQKVAEEKRLRLMVIRMPEGEDPCEVIQEGGGERFGELVERAVDLPEFQVRMTLERADLGSGFGRDQALREVAPVLGAMGETPARAELERLVGDRLNVDPVLVRRAMAEGGPEGAAAGSGRTGPAGGDNGTGPAKARTLLSWERRERAFLSLCIALPEAGREYLGRVERAHLGSDAAARAVDWLRQHLEKPLEDFPREDEEAFEIVSAAHQAVGRIPASVPALEIAFLQLEEARLTAQLGEATTAGDAQRHGEIVRERSAVRGRIRAISGEE